MKKHILLTLVLASLLSCIKTIDFDDEGFANMVVVNSIIWPDSAFSATLLKSSSILEDRHVSELAAGTVDLYENGTLISHLGPASGLIRDPGIKPKAGNTYRIVVTANGQQVEAETTIPLQADVVSVDTTNYKGNGLNHIYFKIKIKDAEGDDYYRLVIVHENLVKYPAQNENDTTRYFLHTYHEAMATDDPVFKSVYNNFGDEFIDNGPENDSYIFPDTYFQGKEHTLQFYTSGLYANPANPNLGGGYGGVYEGGYGGLENNPNDSIYKNGPQQIYDRSTIYIQHLSKDLYNYLKYIKLYFHYHDNPFSEPVPVYSNVKNGTGIFAGFNDDTRFTFEKIYIPFSMDTITVEKDNYSNYYGY